MSYNAFFKIPKVSNEPCRTYAKGSAERQALLAACDNFKKIAPLYVPVVIGAKETRGSGATMSQPNPSAHAESVAKYSNANAAEISTAIDQALKAKQSWEDTPFSERAAIFLKAADLIAGKYRYDILAATMYGQGKNVWQAEIDAAAELVDFLRFNVQYAEEMYAHQPVNHAPGNWNRLEYRPLEGFVYAVSPFNFTAIGGNLPAAPALMGNVIIWKPSPSAIASNWLVFQAFVEAGLPPNVIQFCPGDAEEVTKVCLDHPQFASLHYTGSTSVFRFLYGKIATGVAEGKYLGYPRIVGETGGKNYHLLHHTAPVVHAAINTVRGTFEYQGQKCSACSRAYIPSSTFEAYKTALIAETRKLKTGDPLELDAFVGPVIHAASFNKLKTVIDNAKHDKELELLVGGTYDDSKGYFIHPTVYATTNPDHALMTTELFGPILCIYAYDDAASTQGDAPAQAFAKICAKIDSTSTYALTGAVFATDRTALRAAEGMLRNTAGNFYVNCKSTGSVVSQQPFGGARASGTNDKAGSANLLGRFVSMRSIKEQFGEDDAVLYPSNYV